MSIPMLEVKIQPKFRDNARLILPENTNASGISNNDSVLVLSNQIGLKYSFATLIEEIVIGNNENGPVLEVDKDLVGPLTSDVPATITKFAIPDADRVILYISEKTSVPGGNWGDLLKDQLTGQILDDGGKLLFTYPSSTPIMLSGILESSNPLPPVKLTNRTKVIVEKVDEVYLSKHKTVANKNRADRVIDFLVQIENKSIELIGQIKGKLANSANTAFDFTANPKTIATGVKAIFNSWRVMNEVEEFIDSDFVASYDFIDYKGEEANCIAEIFIISQNDIGKLTLYVHTKQFENPHTMLDDLDKQIHTLNVSARTSARIVQDSCPNCGNQLDFSEADDKGWVRCSACQRLIEIPMRYRYH